MSDGGSHGQGWGEPHDQGTTPPPQWSPPESSGQWGSGDQRGATQGPWASPQPGQPGGQQPTYPPSGYPPPGGAPYGSPHPGGPAYAPYGGGWSGPTTKTSGLAIASLVVSLAGLLTIGFAGIIGFILGLVARSQIKKSGGQLGGSGMALAGIIIGAVMILLFIGFIILIATNGNSNTTYTYNYNSLAHLGSVVGSAR
jgi:hypothetical protein